MSAKDAQDRVTYLTSGKDRLTRLPAPVFAPGLDIIYDKTSRDFYEWDSTKKALRSIYSLPRTTLTPQAALALQKELPQSLGESPAATAFARRFTNCSRIPSPLIVYHLLHDAIRVNSGKHWAGPSLYQYLLDSARDPSMVLTITSFARPHQELFHTCKSVLRYDDAASIFFCPQCCSFLAPESNDGKAYVRVPVGSITLNRAAGKALQKQLFRSERRLRNQLRESAYNDLVSLFKVPFSAVLPNLEPAMVLSLLLNHCLFIEKVKGQPKSTYAKWLPVLPSGASLPNPASFMIDSLMNFADIGLIHLQWGVTPIDIEFTGHPYSRAPIETEPEACTQNPLPVAASAATPPTVAKDDSDVPEFLRSFSTLPPREEAPPRSHILSDSFLYSYDSYQAKKKLDMSNPQDLHIGSIKSKMKWV